MMKPDGFVPAVQRYSARFPADMEHLQVLYLGVQTAAVDDPAVAEFLDHVNRFSSLIDGPDHLDFARYRDERGIWNHLAVGYWGAVERYRRWWRSADISSWWRSIDLLNGDAGYFAEPLTARVDQLETIAFAEYIRGLSACPMSSISAMGESGYWGAARDRIPSSANDRLEPTAETSLGVGDPVRTRGRRISVQPPQRFCLIRSGVSWADCGAEQLASYEQNVKPRLDDGMEHLRSNPIESGCWSLRQVEVIDRFGSPKDESYCAGHFLSFRHLEEWAHHHPTHLAIYGQAQKERIKYQDLLELRTYHEVYVVEDPEPFEYINCYPGTGASGLLPRVDVANVDAANH